MCFMTSFVKEVFLDFLYLKDVNDSDTLNNSYCDGQQSRNTLSASHPHNSDLMGEEVFVWESDWYYLLKQFTDICVYFIVLEIVYYFFLSLQCCHYFFYFFFYHRWSFYFIYLFFPIMKSGSSGLKPLAVWLLFFNNLQIIFSASLIWACQGKIYPFPDIKLAILCFWKRPFPMFISPFQKRRLVSWLRGNDWPLSLSLFLFHLSCLSLFHVLEPPASYYSAWK